MFKGVIICHMEPYRIFRERCFICSTSNIVIAVAMQILHCAQWAQALHNYELYSNRHIIWFHNYTQWRRCFRWHPILSQALAGQVDLSISVISQLMNGHIFWTCLDTQNFSSLSLVGTWKIRPLLLWKLFLSLWSKSCVSLFDPVFMPKTAYEIGFPNFKSILECKELL